MNAKLVIASTPSNRRPCRGWSAFTIDDERAMRLRHAAQDGGVIERTQHAQIDNLDADAFLLQRGGGFE